MAKKQKLVRIDGADLRFVAMAATPVENMSALISEDMFDGEQCWIVPTILMAEGVHNNLFYGAKMFERFVGSWNSEPVTVGHPKANGAPCSAGSPEVLEEVQIGWMFNVRVEGGKLKGDAWISKERVNKISPTLAEMIVAGDRIEVSTGVFIEDDGIPGTWNGESFTASVLAQSPDHLAFLPDGIGACSWPDGGGAPRINHKEDGQMDVNDRKGFWANLLGRFKSNEPSHDDIRGMLRGAIVAKVFPNGEPGPDVPGPYIVDVFDKFVVYETADAAGKFSLYKQAYSITASEEVELTGDAVEVRMKRDFVPVGNNADPEKPAPNDKTGQEGGETNMDRKESVNALIANDESRWGEESRDYLMGLNDEAYAKVTAEPEAQKAAPPDVKPETPAKNEAPKEVDVNAAIEAHPELARALKRERAIKASLVASLVENKRCEFSKEQLEAKDTDELEVLAKMVDVPVDMTGRSTAPAKNEDETEENYNEPVQINWSGEKKEED